MPGVILISNFDSVKNWLVKQLHEKGVYKIAFIIDAKTPWIKLNPEYSFPDKAFFMAAGFDVTMVRLEDGRDIRESIMSADAIYVKGGNSFYLLDAMNKSGFKTIVDDVLRSGKLYVGESAGAYVACPTIEMANWKHQDRNIVELKDLRALALVPFLVSAHFVDSLREHIQQYVNECEYEVELLRDEDVIVYEDGKATRITAGS